MEMVALLHQANQLVLRDLVVLVYLDQEVLVGLVDLLMKVQLRLLYLEAMHQEDLLVLLDLVGL